MAANVQCYTELASIEMGKWLVDALNRAMGPDAARSFVALCHKRKEATNFVQAARWAMWQHSKPQQLRRRMLVGPPGLEPGTNRL